MPPASAIGSEGSVCAAAPAPAQTTSRHASRSVMFRVPIIDCGPKGRAPDPPEAATDLIGFGTPRRVGANASPPLTRRLGYDLAGWHTSFVSLVSASRTRRA